MNPSPFKFLDSYGKEDVATFFGREQETDELYARCTHAQTLVVYGRSGTGKTSLIQCGLRSRFDESDWLPIVIRRGGDLNASLVSELRAAVLTPGVSNDTLELVHNLYLDHFVPVYLLFDQFEELFIFGDEEEQQTFINTARALIEQERHVRLLFIVREEYLAQFTAFEEQVPSILEHRMRVERMPRRRAADVVEKLCASAGIPVEAGFSSALLDRLSVDGSGVELSYVQVLLDQCWKKREGQEPFSTALLERIGQLDDVLGDLLDEQIGQCSDPRKAEALLKAFVSDQGTKRPLTDPEAEGWMKAMGQPMEVADLQRLLQELVDRRLLTERDESGRHELRHDALAARIFERITKVEKEVADVRSFVTQAHKQFTKRGQRLAQADLDYLRPYKHQLHLPDAEERFVEEAFNDELDREKRARRKRRWMVAGLLGLMAAGGLFTLRTVDTLARERRMSESVRLVQRSEELVDSDPQAAYLLAERAWALDTTVNAERALLRAYNSLFTEIARFNGTAVLVAPDHRSFVSIDPLNSFSLCGTNGRVIFTHQLVRPPRIGVKYVADGRYLLSEDSTVNIFDLTGKVLFHCPLDLWHSYNDHRVFTARFGDSLLLDHEGSILRYPLPPRLRKDLGPSIASRAEGVTAGGLIYFVDRDSLFIWDPSDRETLRGWGHSALMPIEKVIFSENVMEVEDRVFMLTVKGLECVDLRSGTASLTLDTGEPGVIQGMGRGILVRAGGELSDPVVYDLNRASRRPRSFKGYFRRYFPATGNVLLNTSDGTHGQYSLVDTTGRVVLRTNGRLIGNAYDQWYLARDHFVVVSEATVGEDSVRVYRSDGALAWSVVVPKITPHLWEERPSLTFDEVGDSVTVCYFHTAVINGRSLQECRMLRNGRTIFYTTKEPFYFYWDQFVFNVLGADRVLLSRWRDGFSLFEPLAAGPLFPAAVQDDGTWEEEFSPFETGGAGSYRFSGGPDDLRIHLLVQKADSLRSLELKVEEPGMLEALKVCTRKHGLFSANGDYFMLWVEMGPLVQGDRDLIWNTSNGSLAETKWTRGEVAYTRQAGIAPNEWLIRNDSLLVLDGSLKELLWSVALDSMTRLPGTGQETIAVFGGVNGRFRVVDLKTRSVRDVIIDTALLDAEFRSQMRTSRIPRMVVENDSTMDLITWGAFPPRIQRIVNGKPRNVVTVSGYLSIDPYGDDLYADVNNSTVHRAFDDAEYFGNFTRSLFRFDTRPGGDLELVPVSRKGIVGHESEASTFRISRYDVPLFEGWMPSFARFDEHRAISSHRLFDHREVFPKDAATVIQYVREKKTYGEFWKHMDTEALFKEPE
ncbi:MAG TPA: hypothetical protein PLB89_03365 [Flavobacteriales bacterium]|nr:hypothetical protein [Flavobacteriales bacterium]